MKFELYPRLTLFLPFFIYILMARGSLWHLQYTFVSRNLIMEIRIHFFVQLYSFCSEIAIAQIDGVNDKPSARTARTITARSRKKRNIFYNFIKNELTMSGLYPFICIVICRNCFGYLATDIPFNVFNNINNKNCCK